MKKGLILSLIVVLLVLVAGFSSIYIGLSSFITVDFP